MPHLLSVQSYDFEILGLTYLNYNIWLPIRFLGLYDTHQFGQALKNYTNKWV